MNIPTLYFDPFISFWWLLLLGSIGGLLVAIGIFYRLPAAILRAVVFILLMLCIMNPYISLEKYEPLKTTIAIIKDNSDSQKLDAREQQTELAIKKITEQLSQFPQFELRVATSDIKNENSSTALFSSLKKLLRDVPPSRIGGAIMITDGQVGDVPKAFAELDLQAPLHAIITGSATDKDRRITLHQAPKFGIVGEKQKIIYSVEQAGINNNDNINIQISIDGTLHTTQQVQAEVQTTFEFTIPHGGKNIIEIATDVIEGEITAINNKNFVELHGVRENLRVLLISGAPHAGERTWRNLLKSDALVDLVHFTILRPAHKEDGTPVNELSLIAFPIRELFIEKIDEFDLIIFDRYKRYNILPLLYFDAIAEYVTKGGAILMAVGSEHTQETSMHTSPMARLFPVSPTGTILQQPFLPKISLAGERHPVTRNLDKNTNWSRWFRHIENVKQRGDAIMVGANENPLLVLDRQGKGRIAMLMSDHVWLWARGFEGGGPHSLLLRRLAHWLMKEPSLEEESLNIEVKGKQIILQRQTMAETIGEALLITPLGTQEKIPMQNKGGGIWQGEFTAETLGLYRFENDKMSALASLGPSNAAEYQHIVSTTEHLQTIVEESGGATARIDRQASNLPTLVPITATTGRQTAGGQDAKWLGLLDKRAQKLVGLVQFSLFSSLFGLAVLLLAISTLWFYEGRNR